MAINPRVLAIKTMRHRKGRNYSAWQQPVLSPKWYTLFCCDCALAHQFQFRVIAGKVKGSRATHHVQYRVKRANLYTQMKRKSKVERDHIFMLKKGQKIQALVDNLMVITLINGLKRGGGTVECRRRKV